MANRLLRAFDSTEETMEAPTALVLVAFVALLAFQAYALYLGQPFDPYSFGMAVGLVMGGGGVASYGQGYMMRSRSGFGGSRRMAGLRSTIRRATSQPTGGSAVVDDPDGG